VCRVSGGPVSSVANAPSVRPPGRRAGQRAGRLAPP
jgi:hypothetical protein